MSPPVWTEDRVDRLKRLWLKGWSAAQISRDLADGISRCAVLGKVHRLGLSDVRDLPQPEALPVRFVPRPMPCPVPVTPPVGPSMSELVRRERHDSQATTAPLEGTKSLRSVGRHDCRWPYGDPSDRDFCFCGRPVTRGAFCAPYARLAYRPIREDLERLAGIDND